MISAFHQLSFRYYISRLVRLLSACESSQALFTTYVMVIQSVCRDSSDVSRFLNVVFASKDIQQRELAKRLNVDPSWLSRSLSGSQNLTLKSFFKLLDTLEIDFNLSYNDNFITSVFDVSPIDID